MAQPDERQAESVPNSAPEPGPRRWWALAAVSLAQLMIVVDMTIVNVALPSMSADLALREVDRQWIITSYTIAFGGLLLLGGRVADLVGRKRALLIGLAGFAVASAVGGFAADMGMLLGARAAQGVFAAVLAPASLAVLATTFVEPAERARAFGIFGLVVAAGSPIGLVLGGVLTTFLGWYWVLFVNVPIAAVAALGAAAAVRGSGGGRPPGFDVPGAALATGGLVAIVYGLSRAAGDGWGAPLTIGTLVAGLALIVIFLVVESRTRHPLLPLPVLWHRARGGAYLVVLLMMAGPFGSYLFVGFFLQTVQGYSALATGLAFLPLTAGVIVASGLSSRLAARFAPRFVIGFGLLLGAGGMALLSRLDAGSSYAADVLAALIMIGFGMGTVLPPALDLATSGVDPRHAGVASAMFNVSNQVGASLTTALLNSVAAATAAGYLLAQGGGPEAGVGAQVAGYNAATTWAAGVLAAGALVAMLMIDARPRAAVGEPSSGDRRT